MNKEKDEDLDKLFKKGMEDPVNEAAYREADWDAMEQMLDKRKKRGAIVFWLPIIGSAAALVLIFLGWMFLKPEVVKPTKPGQMAAVHQPNTDNNRNVGKKENPGKNGETTRMAADSSKQHKLSPANYANNRASEKHGQKSRSFFTLSSGRFRRNTGHGVNTANNKPGTEALATQNNTVKEQPAVVDNSQQVSNQQIIANNAVIPKTDTSAPDKKDQGIAENPAKPKEVIATNTPAKTDSPARPKVKITGRSKFNSRPQFAIGVLASSDLNGVNSSFAQSRVGTNFGATFAITLGNKWTISTGGNYAIKPYLTGFNNYHTTHQFATTPTSVEANCRMLDIPLNVNYQVYSHYLNKITLGTGLSSYFMLREDYKFNYDGAYAPASSTFSVINKNHNILSVLNIDATYTHQVNSKMGVTVQPYLKVPLSDVGASQVRLQTTGVALGLSWNINASSKPK
jgi:hypothetical protein